MTENINEFNQVQNIYKLVEDYGIDVITPIDMDGGWSSR